MGCNSSKLDDEEAVQLCKDRKKFIKQAVHHRLQFATGHIAYIQSLKRVSAALRDYIEGDEPRQFVAADPYATPPAKKPTPKLININISPKCFSAPPKFQSEVRMKISYYRPEGVPPVCVEERPPSPPEIGQVQSYYYGIDGFFTMQQSPPSLNPWYHHSTSNNRSSSSNNNIPPPSPQWDFFWNPFSSLENYGYPTTRSSLDPSSVIMDDDIGGLNHVREAEGIPDLEEETEQEEVVADTRRRPPPPPPRVREKKSDVSAAPSTSRREEEVTVEDVEDEDEKDDNKAANSSKCKCECECGKEEVTGVETDGKKESTEISEAPPSSQRVEVHHHLKTAVDEREIKEETTPGFTVYVNRRPTNMEEVIKELETQFVVVCNSAKEVTSLLEAKSGQLPLSTSNEISPMKMLNPVALFRSGSSRSSSSRFLATTSSSGSRDESDDESISGLSAESSSALHGSHHSTLDRLYTWEKRLYQEVRSGERIRLAYEKKCKQLRNQDAKGEDPSSADKTRGAIRDLHTQIKVAIHSIESISKRIETLRDEELHPQLLELVQGLSRMWKVMAESHQVQKRTLDDAKLLLAGTPSSSKLNGSRRNSFNSTTAACPPDPSRLAHSASNLEAELRNWRSCFETWVTSQRSYVQALTGWLLRCMRCEPDTSKLQFDPQHPSLMGGVPPPIFGICVQWSRLVDRVREIPVLDGLDFFAAGMGSICAQQMKEESRRGRVGGSKRFHDSMEVVEYGNEEEDVGMTQEKMAEVAVRVLCAGMSVAVSSLTEFATGSAQGYVELVSQLENLPSQQPSSTRSAVEG